MILRWYLPLGASLVMAWLMLAPMPAVVVSEWPWMDKAEHLLAYLALTLMWLMARPVSAALGLAMVVYSLVLEFAQGLTSYRTLDGLDLLANVTGVVLAMVLVQLWRSYMSSQRALS